MDILCRYSRKLNRTDKRRLLKEQYAAPAWMRPHLTAIASEEPTDASAPSS